MLVILLIFYVLLEFVDFRRHGRQNAQAWSRHAHDVLRGLGLVDTILRRRREEEVANVAVVEPLPFA